MTVNSQVQLSVVAGEIGQAGPAQGRPINQLTPLFGMPNGTCDLDPSALKAGHMADHGKAISDHPTGSAPAQGCVSMHAASASPSGVAAAQLYRSSMPSAPLSTTPYGEATATGSKTGRSVCKEKKL
jgi:hypothetical protein